MDEDAPPRAGLPSHESAKEAAVRPPERAPSSRNGGRRGRHLRPPPLFDVAGVLANDGSGTILLDLLPKSAPAKGRTWRAARTRRSLAQAGDRAAGAPSPRGAAAREPPLDAEDGAAGVSRMLASTYLGGAAPEEPRPHFEDFDESAGAADDFYDDGGGAAPPPERAPAAAPAAVQETSDIHNDALARFGIKTGDDAKVESRKLRQTLIPMTTEKMEALKDLVKDLSRAKCKDQRNKYKSAVSKITPRPMHLNGFTVLLERVDEQRVQARSLFKHTQIVEQMYQMLSHYDVKIPDTDLVQVDELRSIQAKYAEELEACQAFRDERLAEMTLQLEANVGKFAEQVAHITADLDAGLFIDVANFDMPETVLQELEAVRAKLENLIQSDLLHKKQQKLFGVAETRDKALEKTQEAFDRVRTLWTMVERWDEDYHSWIRDDFLSQNANSVDRDVKLYVRGASNLRKKMANPIIDKLWDLTNAMNDKMPLVRELGDPALRHDHWAVIFKELGEPCPLDLNFTLDQLFRAGLLDHKDFILDVCAEAKTTATRAEVAACLEDLVDKIEGRGSRDNSDDDDDDDYDDDDDDEDYDDDDDDEEEEYDDDDDGGGGGGGAPAGRASVRKSVRKSVRTTGRQHGTARAKKSAGN